MKKAPYYTIIIISVIAVLFASFILITRKANDYIIEDFQNNKSLNNTSIPAPQSYEVVTGTITGFDAEAKQLTILTGAQKTIDFYIDENSKIYGIDKQPSELTKLKIDMGVKIQAIAAKGTTRADMVYIIGEPSDSRIESNNTPTSSPATSTASTVKKNIINKIRVNSIKSGQAVASPLIIDGEARGSWYFEGIFRVELRGSKGSVITGSNAEAIGDWMSADFVPFNVKLAFDKPKDNEGFLVFIKNNPSGLTANNEEYSIPIKFK
jgi:hypothetical protein